jgi:hypothetical protein
VGDVDHPVEAVLDVGAGEIGAIRELRATDQRALIGQQLVIGEVTAVGEVRYRLAVAGRDRQQGLADVVQNAPVRLAVAAGRVDSGEVIRCADDQRARLGRLAAVAVTAVAVVTSATRGDRHQCATSG